MGNVHNPEGIIHQILSEKAGDEMFIRTVTYTPMGATSETIRKIIVGAQRRLGESLVNPELYANNDIHEIYGFSLNAELANRANIAKIMCILSVRNPGHRMYRLLRNHGYWDKCADCKQVPDCGVLKIENNCTENNAFKRCDAVKITCRAFCKYNCPCGYRITERDYAYVGHVTCPECGYRHERCPRTCDCGNSRAL
jgi:hypothetical protein